MKQIDLKYAEQELKKTDSPSVLYVDQNMILIRSVKDLNITDESILVNGFVVVTVKKGHIVLEIANERFEIMGGDTFLCTPRNIIDNALFSADFEMAGIMISPELGQQLTRETGLNVSSLAITTIHKVVHHTPEELDIFMKYHDLLAHTCLKEPSVARNRTIHSLMLAAAQEMFEMFTKDELVPSNNVGYTSAEQIFSRFVQLLHSQTPPLHSVNEYAALLHITPKYFSSICKQVSGRTASDIIHEELLNTARILLRDPQNTIKQVAARLNFANQSHFGTFIRRHTGMSPQQLCETI